MTHPDSANAFTFPSEDEFDLKTEADGPGWDHWNGGFMHCFYWLRDRIKPVTLKPLSEEELEKLSERSAETDLFHSDYINFSSIHTDAFKSGYRAAEARLLKGEGHAANTDPKHEKKESEAAESEGP